MTHDILLKISSLACQDSFYLGWYLARYSEFKEMSMTEVSRELGCLPDTMSSMALCRAPRLDPPHFRDDVERVAERFQIPADRLTGIIRHVQVASLESVLLAARDRDVKEDEDSASDE